jgi:hypothetical protein
LAGTDRAAFGRPGWSDGDHADARQEQGHGQPLAGALPGQGHCWPAAGCDAAGAQAAVDGRGNQAGGGQDAAREAGGRDPLEQPKIGRGHRPQLYQRAAHLEGARTQAAPGEDVQAVERQAVRRESAGHCRPLPRSAEQSAGVLGR